MPGPVSDTATVKAVRGRRPHLHLADLGELDGVAEQVQEHLRQAPLVAFAGWKIGRQRDRERQSFLHRQIPRR